MADISKIILPNGNTYNIKDSWARDQIEALVSGEVITFGGTTTTDLTDGGTEKPIVNGSVKDCVKGQIYFKDAQEFLWDGDKWVELGNSIMWGTFI